MKLTIKEVARSLDLPSSTLERWIRQGRIPVRRTGNTCMFKKSVLEKWAKNHNLLFLPPERIIVNKPEPILENLLPLMKRGGVFYGIKGDDVQTVLRNAVDKIPGLAESQKDQLYEKLIERERLTSTGIGKGIAIPHPRTPLSNAIGHPLITTCFLEKAINFGAVDDKPVFVLFILLSQSVKGHLHFLSRLAFCMRDDAFVESLKEPPAADVLCSRIADFEEKLDKRG